MEENLDVDNWTTQDIRNNARSWTLAADRALLHVLEDMHKDLLVKTEHTREKLDHLVGQLDRTCLSLKNVNNRFMGLSNTQFVESRVQEDDVEIINKPVEEKTSHVIDQSQKDAFKMREAEELAKRQAALESVASSLLRLEQQCERLDIESDSDSDDDMLEELRQSSVLRLNDAYGDTPLPYIIGSQKWKEKWHIGLRECSSDSDSDGGAQRNRRPAADLEEFSSTEDEETELDAAKKRQQRVADMKSHMTLPVQSHNEDASPIPASANEGLETPEYEAFNQKAPQTLRKTVEEDEEDDSPPVEEKKKTPHMPVKASDFAAELARKLGSNPQRPTSTPSVKNDDKEDAVKRTAKKTSYDPRLSSKPAGRITGNIFSDEPPPLENESVHERTRRGDFFEREEDEEQEEAYSEEDEDDLFFDGGKKASKRGLFGNDGLFGDRKTSNYDSIFDAVPHDVDNKKKDSLFVKDSSKSLFDEPKKGTGKSGGLFDDYVDERNVVNESVKNKEPRKTKSKGLFDDFDDEEDDFVVDTGKDGIFGKKDGIFGGKDENDYSVLNKHVKVKSNKGLFDDFDDDEGLFESKNVSDSIFGSNKKDALKKNAGLGRDKVEQKADKTVAGKSKKSSLFGDVDSDDNEDVYAILKTSTKSKSIFGGDAEESDDGGDLFSSLRMPPKKNVDDSKTNKVDDSKTSKVDDSKTSKVEDSKTSKVDDSKTSKVDDSKTSKVVDSKTIKVNDSKIAEVDDSKTRKVDDSKIAKVETLVEKDKSSVKKLIGGVSMFGKNTEILSGPNSLAASLMARRASSSSSGSENRDDEDWKTDEKNDESKDAATESDQVSKHHSKHDDFVKKTSLFSDISTDDNKKEDFVYKHVVESSECKDTSVVGEGKGVASKKDSFFNEKGIVEDVKSRVDAKDSLFNVDSSEGGFEDEKTVDSGVFGASDSLFDEGNSKNASDKGGLEANIDGSIKIKDSSVFGRSNSLFDDIPPPLDDDTHVFDRSKDVNSLFDDDEEDDDLFSSMRNVKDLKKDIVKNVFDSGSIFKDSESAIPKKTVVVSLISDEPPELDDSTVEIDRKIDGDESNMFADYPYYKTVNVVKTDSFNDKKDIDSKFFGDSNDVIGVCVDEDRNKVNFDKKPLFGNDSDVDLFTASREDDMKKKYSIKDAEKCTKPEVFASKPELTNIKPDLTKSQSDKLANKPEILNVKPDVLTSKPNISQLKPNISSSNADIVTNKAEIEIKPDIVKSKPEISKVKPEIMETKSEVRKSKPNVAQSKPDIVKSKPDLATSKAEMWDAKPQIINTKPDISEAKPGAVKTKPEITKTKPELIATKPEVINVKPEIQKSNPVVEKLPVEELLSGKDLSQEVKTTAGNFDDKNSEKEITDSSSKGNVSGLFSKLNDDTNLFEKPSEFEDSKKIFDNVISDAKANLFRKNEMSKSAGNLKADEIFAENPSKSASSNKIGKLSSTLNINVKALMPGLNTGIIKKISNEETEDSKATANDFESSRTVSFDEEPKSLDSVLSNSASKDKAKIQVKRRPSSRRARHEAIRKSAIDINFSAEDFKDSLDFTESLPTSPREEYSIESMNSKMNESKDSCPIQTIGKTYSDELNVSVSKEAEISYANAEKSNVITEKRNIKAEKAVEKKADKSDAKGKFDDLFKDVANYSDFISKDKVSSKVATDDLFKDADVSDAKKSSSKGAKAKSKDLKKVEVKKEDILDLFKNEADSSADIFAKMAPKSLKKSEVNVKNDDIFNVAKDKKVKAVNSAKSTSLFGESDESVDLFTKKDSFAVKDSSKSVFKDVKSNKIEKSKDKAIQKSNLFGDSDDETDLFAPKSGLFGEAKQKINKDTGATVKAKPVGGKRTIFGDDEDSDGGDLFFRPSKSSDKKIGSTWNKKSDAPTSGGLFGDEDDDGFDIFKTNKGKKSSSVVNPSKVTTKQPPATLSSAEVTTQDPLSSFLDD